ncbi:Uncharacterised protein [Enterobacter cloacae]|nr:Uncharacterised protein [Enterobacter cloacae]
MPVSWASSVSTPMMPNSAIPRPKVASANEKIVFFIPRPLLKNTQRALLIKLVW